MFTPNWANGYNDESKGFVSVFLKNQGDDEVSVKCQLITDVKTMEFGCQSNCAGDTANSSPMLTALKCTRTQTLLSQLRLKWQARL